MNTWHLLHAERGLGSCWFLVKDTQIRVVSEKFCLQICRPFEEMGRGSARRVAVLVSIESDDDGSPFL